MKTFNESEQKEDILYYIKVPKCAGTSMVKYLAGDIHGANIFEQCGIWRHPYVDIPAVIIPKQMRRMKNEEFLGVVKYYQRNNLFNNDLFDKSKKFTVVRNIYDRLISAYFYSRNQGWINSKFSFKDFIERDLESWRNNNVMVWKHVTSIYDYLKNKEDSLDYLDYVVEIQNIPSMLKKIHADFKIPMQRKIPHLNQSEGAHHANLYSSYLKSIVFKRYEEEIEFFKFSFKKK